jgi:LmbE family N-acetylglucosaminyl deacetylase
MNVAAFIAHPDYAAFAIGGTLIKHAASGDDVYLVSITPGELGIGTVVFPDKARQELIAYRTANLKKMAEQQGLKEARVLDFVDCEIMNTPELRRAIAELLREFKPEIVITHYPHDTHPDLRTAGQATIDACVFAGLSYLKMGHSAFAVPRMYGFGIYSTENFEPDTFVDVSEVIDKKYEAARALEGMVLEYVKLNCPDEPEKWNESFVGADLYWGLACGARYAEAFKELRPATTAKALPKLGS